MPTKTHYRLPNSLRMGLLVAGLVGLLIGALAWFQVERERAAMTWKKWTDAPTYLPIRWPIRSRPRCNCRIARRRRR